MTNLTKQKVQAFATELEALLSQYAKQPETTATDFYNQWLDSEAGKEAVLKARTNALNEVYPHYSIAMRRSIVEKMGDIDAVQFVMNVLDLKAKEVKYQAALKSYNEYVEKYVGTSKASEPEPIEDATTAILKAKYKK